MNSKITGTLGVGTHGVVYELESGHAIKLFSGGYLDDLGSGPSGQKELEFYEDSKNKHLTGRASPHTLPVYDYGRSSYRINEHDIHLLWAEMAKLKTMKEYWQTTRRPYYRINTILYSLVEYIAFEEENEGDNAWETQEERDELYDEVQKDIQTIKMTDKEYDSLFKTIKSMYYQYGEEYLRDINPDNIGILESSLEGTPIFVLFDP
jgi:hypothetical protein